MIKFAFGDDRARRIAEGDLMALAEGVACTAALWLEQHGHDPRMWRRLSPAHCMVGPPEARAMTAAALTVLDLLWSSPNGSQAISNVLAMPTDSTPGIDARISRDAAEKELSRRGLPVDPESAAARRRIRPDADPGRAS